MIVLRSDDLFFGWMIVLRSYDYYCNKHFGSILDHFMLICGYLIDFLELWGAFWLHFSSILGALGIILETFLMSGGSWGHELEI